MHHGPLSCVVFIRSPTEPRLSVGRSPETPKVRTFDSALQIEAKILSNALLWSRLGPKHPFETRWQMAKNQCHASPGVFL